MRLARGAGLTSLGLGVLVGPDETGHAPQVHWMKRATIGQKPHAAVDKGIVRSAGAGAGGAHVPALLEHPVLGPANDSGQIEVEIFYARPLFAEQDGVRGLTDVAFVYRPGVRPAVESLKVGGRKRGCKMIAE